MTSGKKVSHNGLAEAFSGDGARLESEEPDGERFRPQFSRGLFDRWQEKWMGWILDPCWLLRESGRLPSVRPVVSKCFDEPPISAPLVEVPG